MTAPFRPIGICSECKEPCEGSWVDFGIGSYEYWGQKCNDTNKQWVSKCCEANILTESGSEADPPEIDYGEDQYRRGNPDYDYDEQVSKDLERGKT